MQTTIYNHAYNHVFPYFLSYAGKLLDVHTKHGKEEIKKNNLQIEPVSIFRQFSMM